MVYLVHKYSQKCTFFRIFTAMLYYGLICDIDPKSGYVKVHIPDRDITTEFIPMLRPFAQDIKMSVPFSVNETVIVAETVGEHWVCVGAACSDVDKPYSGASNDKFGIMFPNGTLIEHNIADNKTKVVSMGDVSVTAANVELNAMNVKITAPVIELNGDVSVSGLLAAGAGLSITGNATGTGSITAEDIKTTGNISLKNHKHGGVSPGGSFTAIPTA